MSDVETFTFAKEVKLVDAEGTPIREGSVIRCTEDDNVGVVVAVMREGSISEIPTQIGDLHILLSRGTRRITNRYSKWVHVPREQQSYYHRFQSWLLKPFEHDAEWVKSRGEALAMEGIFALFPEDPIDWEYGETPSCVEDALSMLAAHLDDLTAKPNEP